MFPPKIPGRQKLFSGRLSMLREMDPSGPGRCEGAHECYATIQPVKAPASERDIAADLPPPGQL